MDTNQLQAFDRIVREGSFSRAAWTLQIAQPTISARIAALEDAVGGALFTRTSRRASLTPLGASFLPYARRALAMLNEGVEVARQTQEGQRGRVAVGVLGSLAGCLLGPVLADLLRERPALDVYVRGGSQQKVAELLCDGVVELGLLAWPCVDAPMVELAPVLQLREEVVLAVPRGHALAGRAAVSEEEVAAHCAPLLLVRWWQTTHARVARIAGQARAVANVPPETARTLLCAHAGIGFFTRPYLADLLASGEVCAVPLAGAPLWRDSAVVRAARDAPLSPPAAELVAALRAYAQRNKLLEK